jgi:predicted house-cleaning noncanonical NTP pyrophosphatase (MazG superfamily)
MSHYKKLVRDGIPAIIERNKGKPITRILNPEEYLHELVYKLLEETRECIEEKDTPRGLLAELADLQEVIDTLAPLLETVPGELRTLQEKKRHERGGFGGRVFLVGVEE